MTTIWSYGPPTTSVSLPTVIAMTEETDHAGFAIGSLLEEYKGLPRMEAYLGAIVGMLQPLETLCWQLLRERYLDTVDGYGPAVGTQLDGIGAIVGEGRNNRVDAEYRIFLRVRGLINKSNGRVEELNAIVDTLGADTVHIIELFPARLEVYAMGVDCIDETFSSLMEAKAGGVALDFIYSPADFADTFKFSSTYATETVSATSGFGSVYASTGGVLAGVL